jgi:hypothetical protein
VHKERSIFTVIELDPVLLTNIQPVHEIDPKDTRHAVLIDGQSSVGKFQIIIPADIKNLPRSCTNDDLEKVGVYSPPR